MWQGDVKDSMHQIQVSFPSRPHRERRVEIARVHLVLDTKKKSRDHVYRIITTYLCILKVKKLALDDT